MRTLNIKELTLDELELLEQDLHENREKVSMAFGFSCSLYIIYKFSKK
ncbi:hypothetical protein [Cytobacillus oceanisediminis]|nr:hypothetical protein [Cytobacillus oceanisediminis]